MLRVCLVCLPLFPASAGADELPIAPAPHSALPQTSLVVVEEVPNAQGVVDTRRLLRIGVRNGKLLPAETIWEGEQRFLGHFGGHRLVGNRFLVTAFGGVIDMRDRKVIHKEEDGHLWAVDGTKLYYWVANISREEGMFCFDISTRKIHKESELGDGKLVLRGVRSPDGLAAVESGPVADELTLHQVGAKPKSLGKGFAVEVSNLSSTFGPSPVIWLNPGVILTQRGNGRLVTVDVTGNVTDLLTIKDAPKDLVSAPHFFRDGSNRIIYSCGESNYAIDVEQKAAKKSEWRDLGHGFEIAWKGHDKFGHKLRHNGKELGSINCWPHTAQTAPGVLAVEARFGQSEGQPECVAVWSVEAGKWQTVALWPNSIVGWVK